MKLGELKSAIRDWRGAIKFRANMGGVGEFEPMDLDLVKGVLIEKLDEKHQGVRGSETGLYLTPDGYISRECDRKMLGH